MRLLASILAALLAGGCVAARYDVTGDALRELSTVPLDEHYHTAIAAVPSAGGAPTYIRASQILTKPASPWSIDNRGIMEWLDPAQPPLALGGDRFEVKVAIGSVTRFSILPLALGAVLAVAGVAVFAKASGESCDPTLFLGCFGHDLDTVFGEALLVGGAIALTAGLIMNLAGSYAQSVEIERHRVHYRYIGEAPPSSTPPRPPPREEPRQPSDRVFR